MERERLIRDSEAILSAKGYVQARQSFEIWRLKVLEEAKSALLPREDLEMLMVKFHFVENEYSESDSRKAMETAVRRVVEWLRSLNHEVASEYSETVSKLCFGIQHTGELLSPHNNGILL